MRAILYLVAWTFAGSAAAQESYRYDRQTKASDFARDFFGPAGSYERIPEVDMGRFNAGVSSSLDCGKIDIRADFQGEFKNLQQQVSALIPRDTRAAVNLASQGAMMTVCYAYPTVCAQLRHDFLALQSNLNLRAQACRAIDNFIDSGADKGAKQLRAEAQAECISGKVNGGASMSAATRDCQGVNGLKLRDFQAGMEKKFTAGKQKVLAAMVSFAKVKDKPTYNFLASTLGEIEVQEDGYWQPLFTKGMLRPHDVADSFLAVGESRACGDLARLIGQRPRSGDSLADNSVDEIISRKLSKVDAENLDDLTDEDRRLACAALGRAIGQMAARVATSKAEAVLASGLLNTAIPDTLRDEYRTRGEGAFDALRKAVESDQIPPLEDVRTAIGQLARATREKNRMIAAGISRGRTENYRQESESRNDCTDTLSCGGG